MSLLIKNGTIITASETYQADIFIQGEQIVLIGENLSVKADQVIDAADKLVMPGGIDPHVHLDLPMFGTVSSDDHYTGTKAAAFGGTTTVFDFVSFDEKTLTESYLAWKKKAEPACAVDIGCHINMTRLNEDVLHEIAELTKLGILSLKMFMAYNGRLRLQDGEIFQVMRQSVKHNLLPMLHAENGDVIDILVKEALAQNLRAPIWHARTRPAWGATEAVLRGVSLSAQAQSPLYIVHVNAGGEVDQLAYAHQHGIGVLGETCPTYLFFTEEVLNRPDGAKWICSPPLRTAADRDRLWQGIMEGSLQVIGTDHCPFFYDGTKPITYEGKPVAIPGKELGKDDFTKIPNGVPGVGDRLPILWTKGVVEGRITPNQFVALTSTNAAKIFGCYPRKGSILPGADADLIIWDPNKKITYGIAYAHHRTDYNLYEGWQLTGFLEKTILRGKVIVDGSQWLGKPGMGKIITRPYR